MRKFKIALIAAACTALAGLSGLIGCGNKHDHSAQLVDAVDATCESSGHSAYYSCDDCGKIFADASCQTETTLDAVAVAPLGHTGGTATCTEKAVCTRCNDPYGELADHAYEWVTTDADRHWKECSSCQAEDPENGKTAHVYSSITANVKSDAVFTEDGKATADKFEVEEECACGKTHTVSGEVTVSDDLLVAGENTVTVTYDGKTAQVQVTAQALPRYTLTIESGTVDGSNTVQLKEGQALPQITLDANKTFTGWYKDNGFGLYYAETAPIGYSDKFLDSDNNGIAAFAMPAKAYTLKAMYYEDLIHMAPSDTTDVNVKVGDHVNITDGGRTVIGTRYTWNSDNASAVYKVRATHDSQSVKVNTMNPADGNSLMFVTFVNNNDSDVTMKYQTEYYGVQGELTVTIPANSAATVPFKHSSVNAKDSNTPTTYRGTFSNCDQQISVTSAVTGEVSIDVYGSIAAEGQLYVAARDIVDPNIMYADGDTINPDGIYAVTFLGNPRHPVYSYTGITTDLESCATFGETRSYTATYMDITKEIELSEKTEKYGWNSVMFAKPNNNNWIDGEYIVVDGNINATKFTVKGDPSGNAVMSAWDQREARRPYGINMFIPTTTATRTIEVVVANSSDHTIKFNLWADDWGDKGKVEVTVAAQSSATATLSVTTNAGRGCNYNITAVEGLSAGTTFTMYGYYRLYDGEIDSISIIGNESKHKTTFAVGDRFDTDRLMIAMQGSLGANYDQAFASNYVTNYDGYVFTADDVGMRVVTAYFNGRTVSYLITVSAE